MPTSHIEGLAAAAAGALAILRRLFSVNRQEFTPCNARIVTVRRNNPFGRQIVVHLKTTGDINMKPVRDDVSEARRKRKARKK
jgi:hypothetical protein